MSELANGIVIGLVVSVAVDVVSLIVIRRSPRLRQLLRSRI